MSRGQPADRPIIFCSFTAEEGPFCQEFAKLLRKRLGDHRAEVDVIDYWGTGGKYGDDVINWSVEKASKTYIFIAFITDGYLDGIAREEVQAALGKGEIRRFIPFFLLKTAHDKWKNPDYIKGVLGEELSGKLKYLKHETFYKDDGLAITFNDDKGQTRAKIIEAVAYIVDIVKNDLIIDRLPEKSPEEIKESFVAILGHPHEKLDDDVARERDALVKELSADPAVEKRLINLEDGWDLVAEPGFKESRALLKRVEAAPLHVVQVLDSGLAGGWLDADGIIDASIKINNVRKIASAAAQQGAADGVPSASVLWLPRGVRRNVEQTAQCTNGVGLVVRDRVGAHELALEVRRYLGVDAARTAPLLLQDPGVDSIIEWADEDLSKQLPWDAPLEAPEPPNWYDSWSNLPRLEKKIRDNAEKGCRLILVAAVDAHLAADVVRGAGREWLRQLSENLKQYDKKIDEVLSSFSRPPIIFKLAILFQITEERDSIRGSGEPWPCIRLKAREDNPPGYEWDNPDAQERIRDKFRKTLKHLALQT